MASAPPSRPDEPPAPSDLISGEGTVLIVDDDPHNRRLLRMMLAGSGYRTREATNGREAVEACREARPDLVLMDVMMPEMDGFEATRQLKAEMDGYFVPVIFLTAMDDEASLLRGIECGGDDFLSKPLNLAILKAKIHAMERLRDLHEGLRTRNEALMRAQARQAWEEETAEALFSRAITRRNRGLDRLHLYRCAAATFSGDVVLSDFTPDGGLRVLIGDFTGHGLSAAIGAYPVSETFHSLTAEGVGDHELLHELNHVLHDFLPPTMFMGAILATFAPDGRSVQLWNGGMPDAWLCDAQADRARRIASQAMPLGILERLDPDAQSRQFDLGDGDWLTLISDGVIEASDRNAVAFGDAAILQHCQACDSAAAAYDRIRDALDTHCDGETPSDDMTLVTINCHPETVTQTAPPQAGRMRGTRRWSLEASDHQLVSVDLVQAARRQLLEWFPNLEGGHAEALQTVIAELCNNAFEHGVLRLDSGMKATVEGFEQYYRQRSEGLSDIHGRIGISLRYRPMGDQHCIRIRVRDSGPGFNYAQVCRAIEGGGEERLWGRGLKLVNQLCHSVNHLDSGNLVEADYRWQDPPRPEAPSRATA
ncbi:fused response regulator/phosphatase [Thioalkalivibrio sp. ALJ16]|uniref:fused response regulator/phosphatase n=1 Tax=Thioalkalivibrio sp. ALJ16 TaxID=1158762 RepID=UPI000362D890|nr:fused response regulator/phosphatase [Thioalkalivibrio sp. ALJ16]